MIAIIIARDECGSNSTSIIDIDKLKNYYVTNNLEDTYLFKNSYR